MSQCCESTEYPQGNVTNIYVTAPKSECCKAESCKAETTTTTCKREREESKEECVPPPPKTRTGFHTRDGDGISGPVPAKETTCNPPPTTTIPPSSDQWDENEVISGKTPDKILEGILETPQIGFEVETLGEPTFEEIMNENTPSVYLEGLDPEIFEANDMNEEEAESTLPPLVQEEPPEPEPDPDPDQTPSFTITNEQSGPEMINGMTILSQAVPSVSSQDPDGVNWTTFAGSEWDGIPWDPTGKTKEEICAWLSPVTPRVIRGLRERFYEVNPFADNNNPTVTEINDWNLEVIRHFRNLFGNPTPVQHDTRLYLEARWAYERQRTQAWDTAYPGPGSTSSTGPCFLGGNIDYTNPHCGAEFFPNTADRDIAIAAPPFFSNFVDYPQLDGYSTQGRRAATEGILTVNADIPWSMKFSNVISTWICTEGLVGHPGPYVNPTSAREYFGCAWWWDESDPANVSFRGKWR